MSIRQPHAVAGCSCRRARRSALTHGEAMGGNLLVHDVTEAGACGRPRPRPADHAGAAIRTQGTAHLALG